MFMTEHVYHGHQCGKEIIIKLSLIMEAESSASCTVGRYLMDIDWINTYPLSLSDNFNCLSVALLYDIVIIQHKTVFNFESVYGDVKSRSMFAGAMWDHIRSNRRDL